MPEQNKQCQEIESQLDKRKADENDEEQSLKISNKLIVWRR
jgi:hypothetical protein